MIFYVYALLDPRKNNEPFYIGKGSGDRYKKHGKEKVSYNTFKDNVILSIEKENLVHNINLIKTNLTESEAWELETELILKYGRRGIEETGILTNRTLGGEGASGRILSDETKQRISKSNLGKPGTRTGKSNSEIHNSKISLANKNRSSPLKGRSRSLEVIEKISKSNTGKTRSVETKKKLSESHKGLIQSTETRKKRSESLIDKPKTEIHKMNIKESKLGSKNPMFGKPSANRGKIMSPEQKEKIRLSVLKKIEEKKQQLNIKIGE